MKRHLLWVAAIFLAVGFTLWNNGKTPGQDRPELPEVHYKAANFALPDQKGQERSVQNGLGKPMVLNFWASWCGPCKVETPDLVRFYEQHREHVGMIAVNVTAQDNQQDVEAFMKDYHISYPVVMDITGEVSKLYQIQAMPTSFVLDPEGTIVFKKIGAVTSAELERVLAPYLGR